MVTAQHPIIALWSHPRSMSTATERIMRERGDLACFHEPFLGDYYINRSAATMTHLDADADAPRTYEDARTAILASAITQPVFFKDMSYYVVPRLFEDHAFADRMTHTFLIRDPRRTLASYWKLDPDFTSAEAGLVAQLEHVQWLEQRCGKTPVILEAEAIQADPVDVISRYWTSVGLADADHAFEWSPDATPTDWKHVEGWHGKATQSTGIRAATDAPPAIEVFKAAAAIAPRLHDILNEHWPAYLALRDRARSQSTGFA